MICHCNIFFIQEKIVFNEDESENISNHKEIAPANCLPEKKTKEMLDKENNQENSSEKLHFVQIHELSIYMNGVPLRKFYTNHGVNNLIDCMQNKSSYK